MPVSSALNYNNLKTITGKTLITNVTTTNAIIFLNTGAPSSNVVYKITNFTVQRNISHAINSTDNSNKPVNDIKQQSNVALFFYNYDANEINLLSAFTINPDSYKEIINRNNYLYVNANEYIFANVTSGPNVNSNHSPNISVFISYEYLSDNTFSFPVVANLGNTLNIRGNTNIVALSSYATINKSVYLDWPPRLSPNAYTSTGRAIDFSIDYDTNNYVVLGNSFDSNSLIKVNSIILRNPNVNYALYCVKIQDCNYLATNSTPNIFHLGNRISKNYGDSSVANNYTNSSIGFNVAPRTSFTVVDRDNYFYLEKGQRILIDRPIRFANASYYTNPVSFNSYNTEKQLPTSDAFVDISYDVISENNYETILPVEVLLVGGGGGGALARVANTVGSGTSGSYYNLAQDEGALIGTDNYFGGGSGGINIKTIKFEPNKQYTITIGAGGNYGVSFGGSWDNYQDGVVIETISGIKPGLGQETRLTLNNQILLEAKGGGVNHQSSGTLAALGANIYGCSAGVSSGALSTIPFNFQNNTPYTNFSEGLAYMNYGIPTPEFVTNGLLGSSGISGHGVNNTQNKNYGGPGVVINWLPEIKYVGGGGASMTDLKVTYPNWYKLYGGGDSPAREPNNTTKFNWEIAVLNQQASGNVNTGGGGAASHKDLGCNGGSGYALIRYPKPLRAIGGNVYYKGNWVIHEFTTSGTITFTNNYDSPENFT